MMTMKQLRAIVNHSSQVPDDTMVAVHMVDGQICQLNGNSYMLERGDSEFTVDASGNLDGPVAADRVLLKQD